MRTEGLEPSRESSLEPKSSVSAISPRPLFINFNNYNQKFVFYAKLDIFYLF